MSKELNADPLRFVNAKIYTQADMDEALRNERERCAKIADKYVADMRSVTKRTEYGEGCQLTS